MSTDRLCTKTYDANVLVLKWLYLRWIGLMQGVAVMWILCIIVHNLNHYDVDRNVWLFEPFLFPSNQRFSARVAFIIFDNTHIQNKDNKYLVHKAKALLSILFLFDEPCQARSEGLEHILWKEKDNEQ